MSDRAEQAKSIFLEAIDQHAPDQWPAFVAQACGDDQVLRADVERLLRAQANIGSFHESPRGSATATIDPPNTESAGTMIGPYKLIEPIGEGGMGTVWMAQQSEPVKRLVAVKLIKPGMDSKQVIARFEAERQALALMDHPNIAKVHDGGTTQSDRPYFVMELVKGVPITKYCDEHHLTPRQRLELFVPICHAIQHAHQKGIIHRDLKPSNVLVAQYDGRPIPKVIDFGVAKAAGQALTDKTLVTGFGAIVGTLEYMSPEQAEINQLDIDTRCDIYSLGVLLYELLTGSTPFSKKDLEKAGMLEMLRVIREDEPSKPSTKLSTAEGLPTLAANRGTEPAKLTKLVRGELDWIVMKALEKDRNRRYETANGFAMDVQRYLADEAVMACPPSAGYRLMKFTRRNKGPVLATAVVLLTLLGGIVGTTVGLVQAVEARQAEAKRAEGERAAKERAEANFDLAFTAVEKYLVTVTNDRKLRQADFLDLRKRLLESAIPFFQKLTEQKSDDPQVEARRGRAFGRLARVRRALGENEAAIQDWEGSRAIFARLSAEYPAMPAYSDRLASSLMNLGSTLRHVGKREQVEAVYRQALGIRESLAAEFPGEPEYRDDLANSNNNLGTLLRDLGQREEAEALYRRAIAIREKLAAEFPAKRSYRDGLANSLRNLGELHDDLGKREDAEATYRRALEIQQKLATEVPPEPEYREDLAANCTSLGLVLAARNSREEAEALHLQAIAILNKLVAEFPSVPEYRQRLAGSHINLSNVLDDLDKQEEAVTALRQAIDIQEKLADEFPTVPAYRGRLAAGHNNLGLRLTYLGKREEAKAAYRRTLAIAEKLAADVPNVPAHAIELGDAYCNFGNWFNVGSQPEVALGWFQKAIATLEPVLAKESRLVDARRALCNSHQGKAKALDDLRRHAEAARDWDRAAELDDGRMKAAFRMRALRNRKDAAGCLTAAAEYEAQKSINTRGLYEAARNRAVCAAVVREDAKIPAADAPRLAQEQADLAMAWLHKAIAAGYQNVEHMKRDRDLDALREREDFKMLLAKLEAKKK